MECIFHDDKSRFQRLSRGIQRAKLIPRPYIYRLGMAVCSCRKHKPDVRSLLQASDLHTMVFSVQRKVNDVCEEGDLLKTYIDCLVENGVLLSQFSVCMLFYVLYQSYCNFDYGLLESSISNLSEKAATATPKMPDKQKVFDMIISKRMKRLKLKLESTIQIFPGNLKKLKSSSSYKQLIHVFKLDIVLKYNEAANTVNIADGTPLTSVVYYYNDRQRLDAFRTNLHSAAQQVQSKMDADRMERRHHKAVIRRAKALVLPGDHGTIDQTEDACAVKELLTDDFIKKQHKCKGPNAVSPLRDGHCLNCLRIFEGLGDGGQCKHHPGFIKQGTWTCCGEESTGVKPSFDDHQDTGCAVTVHSWRQRKHQERKAEGYSSSNMAHIFKLSRSCVKPGLQLYVSGRRLYVSGRRVTSRWMMQ